MREIQASQAAFAAILEDGSVVTWGPSHRGGDSRSVQGQLRNLGSWSAFLFYIISYLSANILMLCFTPRHESGVKVKVGIKLNPKP